MTAVNIYTELTLADFECEADYLRWKSLTPAQKWYKEENTRKYNEGIAAGLESKRYDHPEYMWWMMFEGKKYLRSSKSWRVYNYVKCSELVGYWDDENKKIVFSSQVQQYDFISSNWSLTGERIK